MSYFDNAATTYPKPDAVYSFMDSFYRNHGGSVGRGGYALATTAKGLVDETRKLIQELMKTEGDFVSGMTDAEPPSCYAEV